MTHIHYDYSLVAGSIVVALLSCYFAVSLEQMLFRGTRPRYENIILIISGAILGAAIWCMHFVGMMGSHLPANHSFDAGLTFTSYLIAFIASTFAVWLTTRPTLPLPRLILGSVLMGLGISGMHYTGMLGLMVEGYEQRYSPLIVICSVLVAVSGAGLAFWLIFKSKYAGRKRQAMNIFVALMLTFSIVGMHYMAMAGVNFYPLNSMDAVVAAHLNQNLLLFTVLFVTCLVLIAAFSVAVLEQRLEQRNIQLMRANRELANQAVQDNLTRLPNRLFLAEYAHFLFTEHRVHQQEIAFLYIDIDRFKAVNDVFGHHVGDQLLIQMATKIHRLLDEKSKLLRIGGDEFLMVLESATVETAAEMSEKILELMQESFLIAGKEINISGSIGIAMYPEHGSNLQDLLINADAAMLTSKYQGRNTYSVFSYTVDQHEEKSQTKLINDLYKAVEEHQFVLFYQPKFNAKDREICGVEALIRWKHPTLGMLTPNMFINGAEKTGLIIPMGYWALEEACKQIQLWEKLGMPLYPIAVNLSAVQFEHKHLFNTLEMLFDRYEISPAHLIIEITESTAMHHIDASIATFERLRKMGIKVAIDDFGTGHSSFLYLKNLPVDELKIDREFIHDLTPNSKEEMILESIIQLAVKLGLNVTAEGIETPLQADILTRLGCQQLQGYLLGLPMEVARLEESMSLKS
ncbi:EAL domain-containing protein [Acinetobacter gandensis]|uniref:Diguanylate cyclase n=1 Tax=Acinetobacter gandensis TaxID=1443941 RepID=A0A1A7RB29_9GAMM|nr:EAL domain-containing protein [Acinetobacter gandensis]KAB0627579.1 EAL domain-containing protein [Acinetobacter gandensis]OBX28699.1 diguanylate cyclase [Acinetobacter gandensis]